MILSWSRTSVLKQMPYKRLLSYSARLSAPPSSLASSSKTVNEGLGDESTAVRSACLPGTVLEGLVWLKDQKPVVAPEDAEYPDWLWTLLKRPEEAASTKKTSGASTLGPLGTDEARKALRKANRKNIKAANFMKAS